MEGPSSGCLTRQGFGRKELWHPCSGFVVEKEEEPDSPHVGSLSWSLGLLTPQLREGESEWDTGDKRPMAG